MRSTLAHQPAEDQQSATPDSQMSNSHVRSAKVIAGAVAYFCWVLVIGDGRLLMVEAGDPKLLPV